MNCKQLYTVHNTVVEKELSGRYILPEKVDGLLDKLPSMYTVKTIGFSVAKRPIKSVAFGSGKTKILMWSQMHGNESTTTKSLFDFFNFLQAGGHQGTAQKLLENCSFIVIPMLNPDGAQLWTRENANGVDLNRDAQALRQPESKVLRAVFEDFKPDYGFNLHGQRSIFGFEDTGKPSVLSFLAPAADASRAFTFSRKRAASVISHIYKVLQNDLPGQIGLYDDGYNGDCVGDTFQGLGVATVLFEAGHYPDDYEREITRKYIFVALLAAVEATVSDIAYTVDDYKAIPEHRKCFCDVHRVRQGVTERLHYREVLKNGRITFEANPLEKKMGSGLFAYKTKKSS